MSDESRQVGDGAAPQWFRRVTLSVLRDGAESLLEGPVRRAEETEDSPESSRRALDVYTQALQRQAEAPLLWRLRAKAHQRLEHVVEAKADLARAEELETVAMPLHRLNRLLGPQATVGAAKCPLLLARHAPIQGAKDYDAAIRDCYLIFCLDITPREKDLFQLSLQAFQLFLDAQRARGTLDQAADDWARVRRGLEVLQDAPRCNSSGANTRRRPPTGAKPSGYTRKISIRIWRLERLTRSSVNGTRQSKPMGKPSD